jgi:hypothetical protein
MRPLWLTALAFTALSLTACGRPFDVQTPPGFVELKDQEPQYAYRALAPEGVVVGVRVVDLDGQGDLAFWERAAELRMRQLNGYALLAKRDVKSRDGTPGRELDFGHDEHGKPYIYTVRILIAQGRLFLVETGGAKEMVDRYQKSLDWAQASIKVECGGFLYPVLSSHTCNRW